MSRPRKASPPPVTCWWCGAVANSGEHKFKRSDLVRDFGAGAWPLDLSGVTHVQGSEQRRPRSSRAGSLKFAKVLCGDCNSARSQPFDQAYDRLVEHLAAAEDAVLEQTGFAWSDVYGRDWHAGRDNAARYWIKHACTRIASDGGVVPGKVRGFLNQTESRPSGLRMLLSIRADVVAAEAHAATVHRDELGGTHWMGDMYVDHSQSPRYISHWGWRWIRLEYEVGDGVFPQTNFWKERVVMPVQSNIPPERIAEWCEACRHQR